MSLSGTCVERQISIQSALADFEQRYGHFDSQQVNLKPRMAAFIASYRGCDASEVSTHDITDVVSVFAEYKSKIVSLPVAATTPRMSSQGLGKILSPTTWRN